MDLLSIILAFLSLGLIILLGGVLIIGILILIYLGFTGRRWD